MQSISAATKIMTKHCEKLGFLDLLLFNSNSSTDATYQSLIYYPLFVIHDVSISVMNKKRYYVPGAIQSKSTFGTTITVILRDIS